MTTAANRRGIRLMLAAMACFILNDTLVKLVSQNLPAGTLIMLRGAAASALVLVAMRVSGTPVAPRLLGSRWVLIRAGIDGLATFAYLLSLFQLPLANATAINMATPLVITLLAVLWLRESVSALQWAVLAAGFGGVLLVIQPRADGFNVYAWLCLLGTVLHALRDLVTRRISAEVPTLLITLSTAVMVTLMAAVLCAVQGWQRPTTLQTAQLAGAAVFLAGGYHLIIKATRQGDLSVVAPFRYSGLLMAVLLGWAVWGEVPNAWATVGIVLVVASGLLLLRQQRQRQRQQQRAGAA